MGAEAIGAIMKIRYFVQVYPYHITSGGNMMRPFVSEVCPKPSTDGKILTFELNIPDDLFGAIPVEASPLREYT